MVLTELGTLVSRYLQNAKGQLMNKLLFIVVTTLISLGCSGSNSTEKAGFLKSRNEIFVDELLNKAAKAVERSNTSSLDELADQGLDVNASGEHGYNLLYWALRSSEPKSFEKLLRLGANPDALSETGKSVTYLAADSDDSRYLSLALEYGADVNGVSTAEMDTPIFRALGAKSLNNTLILIKNDADVNFQNKFGETPAMSAAALRNFTFVDLMIKNGADHCKVDRWNNDLFYRLKKAESLMDKSASEYQIVKRLLETLPACVE